MPIHHTFRVALALLSLLAIGLRSAQAEAPLALTISGGGTKGAYMGGHLYYMAQANRLDGRFTPLVFTGASAGAINSLIGALSACGPAEFNPRKSLYWEAWTSIGFRELLSMKTMTGAGIFTIDAYTPVLAKARQIWDAGLPAGCDLIVGLAVTRAQPRTVRLTAEFPALPLSREVVLLRLTGQGAGQPPQLRNYVDPDRPVGQLLLPLQGPDAQPFESLASVVLASAAFPVGFSPISIAHCLSDTRAPCTPATATAADFIDGGAFDNQPLGIAIEAMRGVQRGADGKLVVTDVPGDTLLEDAGFYFLDPRVRTYPTKPTLGPKRASEDVLDVVATLIGMIDSSFARELIAAIETTPEVRDRLLLARTWFPQISGTFNGLLDRSFRAFDFHLGMYNAARTIRARSPEAPAVEAAALRKASPETQAAWRPFECLRAVLDGVGDAAICEDPALIDFSILLQVTLDQFNDDCRRLASAGQTPPKTDHAHCAAAMQGEPAPQVPGVALLPLAERRRRADEGILQYQIRLLSRYGLHFQDLGLKRDESAQAYSQIIRLAARVLQRFADVQPRSSWAMGVLTRIGVDVGIGYLPPVHSFYGAFGLGTELGYSVTRDRSSWNWLRLSVAIALDGLSTALSPKDNYFAVIPKIGFEAEVFGHGVAQVRLGLRAGYQLSSADSWTTEDCDLKNETRTPCSRWITEAIGSVSLLGFVRLQLAGVFMPAMQTGQQNLFSIRPSLGMQFNSPF